MIELTIDNSAILAALQRMINSSTHLSPAMKEIGKVLTESTKQRFVSTTSPDGERWALNSVLSTLIDDRKHGDRPLTDHGILGDAINYQLLGDDGVMIGSPMEYAAMQQFGGTKAEFPNLWGDIPARPFLGISSQDENEILTILRNYLESAV